ncbi:hypothetical protein [Corynebacterium heidelbergense]|uniref:Uncharacterized protein n=1 Tax=Corynebacterium heidelbergense TaxID=2055947 RepID=A0A364VE32_9CORY|nr:hypothetical protein [Corynebacterium heidelbergense]RAV34888.1 hypothetical protein CWC39_00685 [Corynebacterium heidelbergense]WCZ36024.1 hypothetical protein CHEID_02285 [Corynebacterium heidelbergense]
MNITPEQMEGMRWEYAVQLKSEPDEEWRTVTKWCPNVDGMLLPEGRALAPHERIIRRLVTEPEVVE